MYTLNIQGNYLDSGFDLTLHSIPQVRKCTDKMESLGMVQNFDGFLVLIDDYDKYCSTMYALLRTVRKDCDLVVVCTPELKKFVDEAVRNSPYRREYRLRAVNNSALLEI